MKHLIKGNLSAQICSDCLISLTTTSMRAYKPSDSGNLINLATANAKETFHMLSADELKMRKANFLGEGALNENGDYEIVIDEKTEYQGGPVELDWYCGSIPVSIPKSLIKFEGFQFNITTLQPTWITYPPTFVPDAIYAIFDYVIPSKWFCELLRKLGLWVICGRVVTCGKEATPLAKLKVYGYDVDMIQDDPLGWAMTDSHGRFVLWYTTAAFSKTIFSWLNIEWPAGPDLYFRIEDQYGTVLLQEPRSKGHTPGRENAHNCTCLTLCVDTKVPPPIPVPIPCFTHVGGYNYETDIHSTPSGDGLTTGDYAFYTGLRLNGVLAQTYNGKALQYCFEYTGEFDPSGNPVNWKRVLADKMLPVKIGIIEKAHFVAPSPGHPYGHYHYNNTDCIVSDAPVSGAKQVPIDSEGWITVPQECDNPLDPAGNGLFVSTSGNQILLNSALLDSFPPVDLSGLVAGQDTTSTGKPLAQDKFYALRMLIRPQVPLGDPTITPDEAGTCQKIAIDNTLYKGIVHHPEWGKWESPSGLEYGVCMVDIQELIGHGCKKIGDTVTILYSFAHPNLGPINMTLAGPIPTLTIPIPASPDPKNRFGSITHVFGPGDPQCAYMVTISAYYLLTTGDHNEDIQRDQIAFCR
jgi:hypothetical protein